MLITPVDLTMSAKIATGSDTPAESHRSSDLNFFLAEISKTDHSDKRSPRAVTSADSAWALGGSSAESKNLSKGFRDASLGKKSKHADKFPEYLAKAHIESISNVKVIGAIAKACDKISSMG